MIKECNVIINNKEVLVVNYDGMMVQLPNSTVIKTNTVFVKFKNGKYFIVGEGEYKKSLIKEVKVIKKKEIESNDK